MNTTDKILSFHEWFVSVDHAINSSIAQCYPRFWKEDGITQNMLMAITREKSQVVVRDRYPNDSKYQIEWDAFKLDGRAEEERGDVAILVRHFSGSTVPFEGVGFFESKKFDGGVLSGISSWNQLEVMRLTVPHHILVIYDHEPQPMPFPHPAGNHCAIIPTNRILALRKKSRELYEHTRSFSHQLCQRYVFGFDLEYDECSKARAKGFLGDHYAPKCLLVINVGRDGVETSGLDQPGISPAFRRLGENDRIHHEE